VERIGTEHELGVLVATEVAADEDPWALEASLEELAALAASAGVTVVGRLTQRLDRVHPATYVGTGKVGEVRDAALDLNAEVALFDRELSPRQQRNLERALGIKVIDRTALILDVFAQHARTREGMLQVELAQWEYRLPRLTRMWTHLARQAGGRAGGAAGGVGVRGPGETQIELDRREIRRRIRTLDREIEALRGQRRQSRRQRRRSGLPGVSLVGYTNAGKSTLLNGLTQADVYTADQLFATLDPTTRRVHLPSGRVALMSDTVGFIQKLPTQLVASFRATLEEIVEADLLLHVVDVTHPDAVQQAETVELVLRQLGMVDPPMVVAANKLDLLPGFGVSEAAREGLSGRAPAGEVEWAGGEPAELAAVREVYPDLVAVSARLGAGFGALLAAIERELDERLIPVEVLVPYAAAALLQQVHTRGVVDEELFEEGGIRVRARVPTALLGSLGDYVVPGPPATSSAADGAGPD